MDFEYHDREEGEDREAYTETSREARRRVVITFVALAIFIVLLLLNFAFGEPFRLWPITPPP